MNFTSISQRFLPERIKALLNSEDERSKIIITNIFLSFIYKGINIFTQLALVPLTIAYLDKDQYGIWLTLGTIIGWFSFFDVGLGNGLRNRLAEAIANQDFNLARKYVSTSYALLTIIFLSIILIFSLINPYLNWAKFLNAPGNMKSELSYLALITFLFFCLRFIFGLISNILFALQKPALNNLITAISNILTLALIYFLTLIVPNSKSLIWVGTIYSAIPVLIFAVVTVLLFSGDYKHLKPGAAFIDFSQTKDLLGLGYKFFVIQVAAIILFSSTNILIAQLFGPSQVTAYNIAYRYFMVLSMIYSIIITPMWSAFTDAFAKQDKVWIKSIMGRLNKVTLLFIIICFFMIYISDEVYSQWIGQNVHIPKSVSFCMGIFVIFGIIASPYNSFINGTGKIKLQFYTAIASIVITIPLAVFFASILGLGITGIILATLATTIPCTFLWKIQFEKIINNKASGIWAK